MRRDGVAAGVSRTCSGPPGFRHRTFYLKSVNARRILPPDLSHARNAGRDPRVGQTFERPALTLLAAEDVTLCVNQIEGRTLLHLHLEPARPTFFRQPVADVAAHALLVGYDLRPVGEPVNPPV